MGTAITIRDPRLSGHRTVSDTGYRRLLRSHGDWFGFAVLAILAAIAIAHFGRGWSFFYDEWGVIIYRRSGGIAAFAAPLNGHLVAVTVAIYRLLFAAVGLGSYTPFRWVTIAGHLGLVALFYAYARRRLSPLVALISAALLLFLGYAWEVLFWMMNLGFILPLIAFVAILLVNDRERSTLRASVAKALLLALALASSGLGVAVAAGAIFEELTRRRWRDLAWLAAPVVAYAIWFFAYRPTAATPAGLRRLPGADPRGDVGALGFSLHNVHRIPHYIVRLAESAAGGVLGTTPHLLWLLIVAGLIVGGVAARRRITPRFGGIAIVLIVFWLLTALVRAEVGQPGSSRYVYPGAVLLVLLVVEAWGRFAWGRLGGAWTRRVALVLLASCALVALGSSVRHLEKVGDGASRLFVRTNAELARLSCERTRLPPSYDPDPTFMPFVRLDPYLAAARDLGSPVPRRLVRSVCGE